MISVLIVTHNNAGDIPACLDSLPWPDIPLEVLVIDNRSRDDTGERLRQWKNAHPSRNLRLFLNRENRGFAAGINQGLANATGDPLLILGPDTALFPDTLPVLSRKLSAENRVGAAAPRILDWRGNLLPSCRRFPRMHDILFELTGLPRLFPGCFTPKWKMPEFDHRTEREVDQPEATCLLVRRGVIDSAGMMDERFPIFFNDVDWCLRIRRAGWKILFAPGARIRHRKGTSVRQDPMHLIWKSHQGCFRYFRKHRSGRFSLFVLSGLGILLIWTGIVRSVLVRTGIFRDV
ncbi:MAG TPA: glycosyltransferase family 2 protein [bacterium]|nr:glycosyltransferase family 2 protein [bacterium]